MKKLLILTAAIVVAASSVQAGTIYNITSDHSTGGLGTPPFGTVTLTQDGANVDFLVHLASGYQFVTTGAADDQYFKFNGTGVSVGDIQVTDATLKGDTGTFNGDGTGNFLFGIAPKNPSTGINPRSSDISFTVLSATIADLTQPNNLGIIFVADLLAPNGNTGPADVSVPGVPDGGLTIALLGLAMLGLGSVRRLFS